MVLKWCLFTYIFGMMIDGLQVALWVLEGGCEMKG